MTRIATWLLSRSGGCPRGARHRLWLVTLVAAAAASQVAFSLSDAIPAPGAIPVCLGWLLAGSASALLFARMLVPIEHSIVAAHGQLPPKPEVSILAPVAAELTPAPAV